MFLIIFSLKVLKLHLRKKKSFKGSHQIKCRKIRGGEG